MNTFTAHQPGTRASKTPPQLSLETLLAGNQTGLLSHNQSQPVKPEPQTYQLGDPIYQFTNPAGFFSQATAVQTDPIVLNENLKTRIAEFAKNDREINEIRKNYVLPVNSSVAHFLSSHRTLPQILSVASPHLKDCFGSDVVCVLELMTDEDDQQGTLYAVVKWPGSVDAVSESLSRFDGWWLPRSPQARGNLVFTYELV